MSSAVIAWNQIHPEKTLINFHNFALKKYRFFYDFYKTL